VRVLVTGHDGYVGCVLMPMLRAAGHEAIGLDSGLYVGCSLKGEPAPVPSLRTDVRDVRREELDGFEAVIHLAALSNDPLGDYDPSLTDEINRRAAVRLARVAKEAGVSRFLFSSSCSLYGAAGERMLDETAQFQPVTPYGRSKVLAEQEIAPLADDDFSPVFLRSATAYGVSPRLRGDLVVNNLVGFAHTTGSVKVMSDGTPWRPLVHVEDMSRAFVAVLEAARERVHGEIFNVGRSDENYRVSEVAEIVAQVVAGSRVEYAPGGGPDPRCYRVSCDKLPEAVPSFVPRRTVRDGAEELRAAMSAAGLTEEEFLSSRFLRIKRVHERQRAGELDDSLRPVSADIGAG
jgi:nucleoside-diphosphate-sugar epimerase